TCDIVFSVTDTKTTTVESTPRGGYRRKSYLGGASKICPASRLWRGIPNMFGFWILDRTAKSDDELDSQRVANLKTSIRFQNVQRVAHCKVIRNQVCDTTVSVAFRIANALAIFRPALHSARPRNRGRKKFISNRRISPICASFPAT